MLYTELDVVGLVHDWHLEYQNDPQVVVDRYTVIQHALQRAGYCGSGSGRASRVSE